MRVRTSHVLFSVCLIASAACGRAADEQPPVAAPSVSLSSDRAAIGSPLRMTYRFEPTDQKIAGDFLVFVHVLDEDGELALVSVDPKGMKILSQAKVLERYAWAAPTLVDKTLYLRDRKKIMALDLSATSG